MWSGTLKDVEDNCHWGISIMEGFIANDKMRAHCQGYYRDTYKFLIAAYLRNNEPEKAALEWNKLNSKIDEYVLFCEKINSMEKARVVEDFGEKAAKNMSPYSREWINSKLEFMLGQLKSWSDEKVFDSFQLFIDNRNFVE